MKLLVNKLDDSDPKPHFTSIIAPLHVKPYNGLLNTVAVCLNNTFKIFNSKQFNVFTNAILGT